MSKSPDPSDLLDVPKRWLESAYPRAPSPCWVERYLTECSVCAAGDQERLGPYVFWQACNSPQSLLFSGEARTLVREFRSAATIL